jgi:hypothetical protein
MQQAPLLFSRRVFLVRQISYSGANAPPFWANVASNLPSLVRMRLQRKYPRAGASTSSLKNTGPSVQPYFEALQYGPELFVMGLAKRVDSAGRLATDTASDECTEAG